LEFSPAAGSSKSLEEIFDEVESVPILQILPLTREIATEAGSLGSLRDPADRAIVATARVHWLKLMTSDRRIIDSKLAPVIV
jgi:PIN domain nuclease of toxin-antitoxin system